MNKKHVISLFFGIFINLNLAAFGDGMVKFPTGPAAWTVEITSSNEQPSSPPPKDHVTAIEVAQNEKERRSLATWSDGKIKETWNVPGMNLILTEASNGHPYAISEGGIAGDVLAVPFGLHAFEWLEPRFLQEKEPISYHGKQCFHYKGTYRRNADATGKLLPPTPCEAWIDSTTLFPVGLDDGMLLGVYTYSKDPPPPLVMSAKFQSKLDRWELIGPR